MHKTQIGPLITSIPKKLALDQIQERENAYNVKVRQLLVSASGGMILEPQVSFIFHSCHIPTGNGKTWHTAGEYSGIQELRWVSEF